MTPAQRREVAQKAAQARWAAQDTTIPAATHMGVLKIGDAEIPCAVLEDGRRVLTQRAFLRAIGRDDRAKGRARMDSGGDELPPFLAAKNLEPFIHKDFSATTTPAVFKLPAEGRHQSKALGYRAELLPEVCRVFVEARRADALTKNQLHIADKCELLLSAFATVGIIALVDEATGYQAERQRDELEKMLAAYINPELRPWTRTFPDEYYQELFRLLGWSYTPMQFKRPKLIGKITDEIIYKQLPPGVREELRRKNPPSPKGNRPHRYPQLLTMDIGVPHLQNQMLAAMTLMRASKDHAEFRRLYARAFPRPKKNAAQLELPWSRLDSKHLK
jgi:hypothetical protein